MLATVNGETFEVFLEEKEIATPVIPTQASPKTVAAPVRVAAKVVKPAATITSKSVVAPIPGVIELDQGSRRRHSKDWAGIISSGSHENEKYNPCYT